MAKGTQNCCRSISSSRVGRAILSCGHNQRNLNGVLWIQCFDHKLLPFFVWNSSDPKSKYSFYAFIVNNKVPLYLYSYLWIRSSVIRHSAEPFSWWWWSILMSWVTFQVLYLQCCNPGQIQATCTEGPTRWSTRITAVSLFELLSLGKPWL